MIDITEVDQGSIPAAPIKRFKKSSNIYKPA